MVLRAVTRATTSVNRTCLQVVNVLTSYAIPKKSLRRFVLEWNRTNIVSFAGAATITTTTIFTASFANKSTPLTARTKTMINGLAATIAKDGYHV